MNLKDFVLEECELHSPFVEEGVSAIVNSILFVRAPNQHTPVDHVCATLSPLTYVKCGPVDIDETVRSKVDELTRSLTQVGPKLYKGVITVSFYEKREVKQLFGFMSSEEKVYFERWRVPILVNEEIIPRSPLTGDDADLTQLSERARIFEQARESIQKRILSILELSNISIDHLPTGIYHFEIGVPTKGAHGERAGETPSLVTKILSLPTPL